MVYICTNPTWWGNLVRIYTFHRLTFPKLLGASSLYPGPYGPVQSFRGWPIHCWTLLMSLVNSPAVHYKFLTYTDCLTRKRSHIPAGHVEKKCWFRKLYCTFNLHCRQDTTLGGLMGNLCVINPGNNAFITITICTTWGQAMSVFRHYSSLMQGWVLNVLRLQ